ncbi:MAG: hypothetical protein HC880_01935 [Bacteroidia bacterium]|nr:hypothetical protein [Bacteroidia bacterium]
MGSGGTATLASNISGNFTTALKISGELGPDLMPLYNDAMNGLLSASINQAVVKNAPILSQLSAFTKLGNLNELRLSDVLIKGQIKNGMVEYQPFNVKAGEYNMNVSGRNSLNGALDLLLKMDVPVGQIGRIAQLTLSTLTGKNVSGQDKVQLDFKVGGTFAKPSLNLVGSDGQKTVKEQAIDKATETVKEKAREKLDEKLEETFDQNSEELAENIMNEAREKADKLRLEARKQANQLRQEADAKEKLTVEEAAKKGPIAKKAAEIAAKR